MRVELVNTARSSSTMESHYQRLVDAGWGAMVSKETRTIKGFTPSWDIEESTYELILASEIDSKLLFDLSDVLGEELIVRREGGKPVIEIYDDWRE